MNGSELDRYMRLYYKSVYRTALCRCKNPQDADDTAQEVFLKLYTCGKRFNDDEHVKAWLLRCAVNQSTDIIRSQRRHAYVSLDNLDETAGYDSKNTAVGQTEDLGVFDLFLKLSERNRTVMYMHYCEGYSVKEIAEMTQSSQSAVLSRLMRGRRQLEKLLKTAKGAIEL